MRAVVFSLLGLVLASCGLSMNPDLPSAEDGGSPGFGSDGDATSGDGDGGIDLGGGSDPDGPPIGESPGGASGWTCAIGPGGAGGADPKCEESR